MLFNLVLVLGALGSFGSFVLLALTFYRSYQTDRPAEVVWEKHPHERGDTK
jgi:hypothetical protein